jgi:MFS family permease
MAALDDIVGVVVFFTVNAIVGANLGSGTMAPFLVVLMILLPFLLGAFLGFLFGLIAKHIKNRLASTSLMVLFLVLGVASGTVLEYFLYSSFVLNYFLFGMSFMAVAVNLIPPEKSKAIDETFSPLLSLSLLIVIVSLGMPLDIRSVLSHGTLLFTIVYILFRAIGKIFGAKLGAHVTKEGKQVEKYLGLVLLPHSGVSLVFTGIAISTISGPDPASAKLLQGTIVAAAILNEIIAVLVAKVAFTKSGEIGQKGKYTEG